MSIQPKIAREPEILVADEAWLALALLYTEHPERGSFSAKEILDRVRSEGATKDLRPGVQIHIYQHNVANRPPNPGSYRMFWALPDKSYRLFRPGDQAHPSRNGKIEPQRDEFPQRYHYLLDWYEREYCRQPVMMRDEDDPVLSMRGVGKEVWAGTDADEYVRSLRSDWYGGERDGQ